MDAESRGRRSIERPDGRGRLPLHRPALYDGRVGLPGRVAFLSHNPYREAVSTMAAGPSSDFDLIVLGAGTGGYSAAFRAAQLGMRVALVDRGKIGGT